MSVSVRKFVAVLLAFWLPLFSGGVLAVSVSMQMPHGTCHEMMQDIHQPVHSHSDQPSGPHNTKCEQCSICHLACGNYLGMQEIRHSDDMQVCRIATPYLLSFYSITSTPLLPPPLV
jgi:hypothetical protein